MLPTKDIHEYDQILCLQKKNAVLWRRYEWLLKFHKHNGFSDCSRHEKP